MMRPRDHADDRGHGLGDRKVRSPEIGFGEVGLSFSAASQGCNFVDLPNEAELAGRYAALAESRGQVGQAEILASSMQSRRKVPRPRGERSSDMSPHRLVLVQVLRLRFRPSHEVSAQFCQGPIQRLGEVVGKRTDPDQYVSESVVRFLRVSLVCR